MLLRPTSAFGVVRDFTGSGDVFSVSESTLAECRGTYFTHNRSALDVLHKAQKKPMRLLM